MRMTTFLPVFLYTFWIRFLRRTLGSGWSDVNPNLLSFSPNIERRYLSSWSFSMCLPDDMSEPLEEFPASLEVCLKGRDEQRLAEPPRPAQEDVASEMCHPPYILCLVNIEIVSIGDFLECLYANRQTFQLILFHILIS